MNHVAGFDVKGFMHLLDLPRPAFVKTPLSEAIPARVIWMTVKHKRQEPPTEDEIKRLNSLVKQPPFCYLFKAKEFDPR